MQPVACSVILWNSEKVQFWIFKNSLQPYNSSAETPPPAYSPRDDCRFDPNGMDMDSNPARTISGPSGGEPVHYEEPPYWCSIAYYELNSRVGEIYHAQVWKVLLLIEW